MRTILSAAQFANLHFVTPHLAVGGDLHGYDNNLAARQLSEIRRLGIPHRRYRRVRP